VSRPAELRTRLVFAEIMKIRTTPAWLLFGGGFTIAAALAILWNWEVNHRTLYPSLADYSGNGRAAVLAQAAAARTSSGAAAMAASMMTSGQFLLVLITLLLGVHLVTGEFAARTMASTFLVTPRRGLVIAAKLVTAAALGLLFWAITTALDGVGAPLFLAAQHLPASALLSSGVFRAVLMGLLAYLFWALFGLGLGAVVRNPVIAVVAVIAIYAGGFAVVELIVHLLYLATRATWLLSLAVLAPAQASNVMITSGPAFPHAPPWWAGALVMAGYAAVLATCGVVRMARFDVT
jgi:ABC-2 type transport system permease protein